MSVPSPSKTEVGGAVLVAERVAADDDRLVPAGHEARDVGDDDRLAEDDAAEDVADRAVRALPHLLEAELLDARLVGRDRGALDADAVLLDGVGRVDRDLVVGRVAVLDAEVVVLEVDVEVGVDEAVLDELPDDAGHLVAVEFDDGAFNLDLRQECLLGSVGDWGKSGGREHAIEQLTALLEYLDIETIAAEYPANGCPRKRTPPHVKPPFLGGENARPCA